MTPSQFITDYKAALASQQWQQVEPLMHTNVCVTFSNGTVHKGLAQVKEAYQRNFAAIKNEDYLMTDVHWILTTHSTAIYLFNFSWRGVINGQQASGAGHGTAVLVQEDGTWKMIAEHLGRAANS
ncbi:MAG TPA: nuclear transport factor 2 family protein [Chitinophagales bacterium]|nr:nuclear transport factor 2 family protein [Chitinophagales bacterium]